VSQRADRLSILESVEANTTHVRSMETMDISNLCETTFQTGKLRVVCQAAGNYARGATGRADLGPRLATNVSTKPNMERERRTDTHAAGKKTGTSTSSAKLARSSLSVDVMAARSSTAVAALKGLATSLPASKRPK